MVKTTTRLLGSAVCVLLIVLVPNSAALDHSDMQPTKKFMGWYGAPSVSTDLNNFTIWAQNGNNAYVHRWPSGIVEAQRLFPHLNQNLLALEDDFITITTNSEGKKVFALIPDWKQSLMNQVPLYTELLNNGTIVGFFLGDELMWNCFPYSQLTEWSNTIRSLFPDAFLWENEAEPVYKIPSSSSSSSFSKEGIDDLVVNCSAPGALYSGGCCLSGIPVNITNGIPPALNVSSIDLYAWDPKENKDLVTRIQSYYSKFLKPRLHPGQKLFVIPGADASNFNRDCNFGCYDTECANDATEFADWVSRDPLLAGAVPWTWVSCGKGCDNFKDEIGCEFMPKTRASWKVAGKKIMKLDL